MKQGVLTCWVRTVKCQQVKGRMTVAAEHGTVGTRLAQNFLAISLPAFGAFEPSERTQLAHLKPASGGGCSGALDTACRGPVAVMSTASCRLSAGAACAGGTASEAREKAECIAMGSVPMEGSTSPALYDE